MTWGPMRTHEKFEVDFDFSLGSKEVCRVVKITSDMLVSIN
jgi:hypothetical protein